MEKKSVYLNQRVRKDVVKRLRKYEKVAGLKGSISSTIEHLLDVTPIGSFVNLCAECRKEGL